MNDVRTLLSKELYYIVYPGSIKAPRERSVATPILAQGNKGQSQKQHSKSSDR